MIRALAGTLVFAALATTGCRYCCSPFDECGPVYENGHCRIDEVDGRMGSAFAPQATQQQEDALFDPGTDIVEQPAGE